MTDENQVLELSKEEIELVKRLRSLRFGIVKIKVHRSRLVDLEISQKVKLLRKEAFRAE